MVQRNGHYATTYSIPLAPLPCWKDLSEQEYRDQVTNMVIDIVEEAKHRWELEGKRPMGAAAILRQDPWSQPKNMKVSPAPICHASKLDAKIYKANLHEFHERYDWASEQYRKGELDVEFPDFCFRPAGPFVWPERPPPREPPPS